MYAHHGNLRWLVFLGLLMLGAGPSCHSPDRNAGVLHVFAASSLADLFKALKTDFESAYPDANVNLTCAGSQILRLQIEQGAPAHVFASAHLEHAQSLADLGRLSSPQVFARTEMSLITPAANPAAIESFSHLHQAKRIVMGAENVPVGRYTAKVLEKAALSLGTEFRAAVDAHTVSRESNARLVRTKVQLGEADAAFVYRTDVVRKSGLRRIEIPPAFQVTASYFYGFVQPSRQPKLERAWADFMASKTAKIRLKEFGFWVP